MKNQMTDLYRALTRHFSALSGVPISVVDAAEREILFTERAYRPFFCDACPNRCRLLSTMLYGHNEARRWNGRYVFYCPIGLVFSAVIVPETNVAMLAGPVVMGELQDTLLDLPEYIEKNAVRMIPICTANSLHHLSSVLEMAVFGLIYRPDEASYDTNVIADEETVRTETAAMYSSFPYLGELEEQLRQAVTTQDKAMAKKTLNELLGFVYAPTPEKFPLIKSRAQQLTALLSKVASDTESGEEEKRSYRADYMAAIKSAPSLEEMDVSMTEILHHFMDCLFDFSEIKHSDTTYRIMEYIRSNYAEKISLEDIASYVHLSSSHVSSIFRKETGQTIFVYLNQVRIEKSKTLLKKPDLPIAEIAARCGFEDQSYFTRVFKKQTGISPKRYRDNTLQEVDFDPPAERGEARP